MTDFSEIEAALAKLTPGFLPLGIFLQVARLTVTPTVELVGLRKKEGSVEILLTRRPKDDKYWPNMWHIQGSVIRATDKEGDFSDVFTRILQNEMGNPQCVTQPTFFKYVFQQVKRGREVSFIHWIELTGEPPKGEFFDINDLPEDMIDHQKSFIHEIARNFL